MISKITKLNNLKGISISTSSYFIKKTYFKKKINYLYKSVITISNNGKNSIQILSRHKKVFEIYGVKTLNSILKEKPIIKPGKKIILNLDYSIKSKLATIIGYFSIISLNNSAIFKAHIPKIKLTHPEILN